MGAVGYLSLEAFAAAGNPHYSYAGNYISDLGAVGPRTGVMHAAFFLHGIFFLLGAVFVVGVPGDRRARLFLGLAAVNAAGNVVVGIVPAGGVHVIGAAMAIVGGNAAILAGAPLVGYGDKCRHTWYGPVSNLIAAVGLSSLLMLLVDSAVADIQLLPDGVWERGSVYSITCWQLLTAVCLLADRDVAR
ncbi:DUF998 domain-containing protein [Mycobacterium asiaticum]|uniref:DUF998 domain-containing protein n=1 Tax=Mycobacterium asiaticum TaxID=1790 RepID=UPI000B12A45F|nr:DUF998 domain-containing protein [Mycobacterium asiaticum]